MASDTSTRTVGEAPRGTSQAAPPNTVVIFGASGDLTKRLLMPAFYNLACDGLLPKQFAIIGTALTDWDTEKFRAQMTSDIKQFSTRQKFDEAVWKDLVSKFYYTPGSFNDAAAYEKLAKLVAEVESKHQITTGNLLFYMAVPPAVFGLISDQLSKAGFKKREKGWQRIIVEKPFGTDLPSAIALNRELLAHWSEDQIYRIDHYLGKETVQNLLAFRFSNGMFEPLWNQKYIDHIQFTVSESVGVEGRGGYYDKVGVLRDMIQNHMFQMLAYLTMEPPTSFKPDAIRNEKSKVLDAVRVMSMDDVRKNTVRGQYGAGKKPDGTPVPAYRNDPSPDPNWRVDPNSRTETFAAMRLYIDNWRWDGVPIYLRSGKALWKRGTEIVVQFKRAPEVIFRDTPAAGHVDANMLLFHIQPDQGIEIRFQAKTPGPLMQLQKVNMRFDYKEAFEASRGTGYEVLLYNCMIGDATLFSRTDLVEIAWRIAQPLLDTWKADEPRDFPNYPAGSWGPRAAYDLIESDGRHWLEIINREVLEKVPLFQGSPAPFLQSLTMMLKADVFNAGDYVFRRGDPGSEMYFIARGQAEVLDAQEHVVATLAEGNFFGELALLFDLPRNATIRAKTNCDLFVLGKDDFQNALKSHPEFASQLRKIAHERYHMVEDHR